MSTSNWINYEYLELDQFFESRFARKNPAMKLSVNDGIKALMLGRLSLRPTPLSHITALMSTLPLCRLFGRQYRNRSQLFNEHRLGRVLDSIYEYGPNKLMLELGAHVFNRLKLKPTILGIDTTSITLHGKYPDQSDDNTNPTKGFNKDGHRNKLQYVIGLISDHATGIPMGGFTYSGNAADSVIFHDMITRHIAGPEGLPARLEDQPPQQIVVGDCKLYSKSNIEALKSAELFFITRHPSSREVKELLAKYSIEMLITIDKDYKCLELIENVPEGQRWVLYYSTSLAKSQAAAWEKTIEKEKKDAEKAWKAFKKRYFDCDKDARRCLDELKQQHPCLQISQVQAETVTTAEGNTAVKLQAECAVVSPPPPAHGYFILSTSYMESASLTPAQLLDHYKDKQSVESNFQVYKSYLTKFNTVWLKKINRIQALIMVNILLLMLIAVFGYLFNKALSKAGETISPKQTGLAVFRKFMGVHCWIFPDGFTVIKNLDAELEKILELLGPVFQKHYQ